MTKGWGEILQSFLMSKQNGFKQGVGIFQIAPQLFLCILRVIFNDFPRLLLTYIMYLMGPAHFLYVGQLKSSSHNKPVLFSNTREFVIKSVVHTEVHQSTSLQCFRVHALSWLIANQQFGIRKNEATYSDFINCQTHRCSINSSWIHSLLVYFLITLLDLNNSQLLRWKFAS